MSESDKFRNMSDDDLAKVQEGLHEPTLDNILIEREWLRRDRIEQHKLDLDLVLKQVRWMKFAVLAGVLSALLGVILGWLLQRNWPPIQSENIAPKVQSQTSSSTVVDRKENGVTIPHKLPVRNSSNHWVEKDARQASTSHPKR